MRLERLGFERVYDYVAGKSDWTARALPAEGEFAAVPKALDATRRDAPTCGPEERLADVKARLEAAGEEECVVVDGDRVVLGRLRPEELEGDGGAPVEAVMEVGPTTIRPDVTLHEIIERMAEHGVPRIIVTDPEGRLFGVMERSWAESIHGPLH